MYKRVLLKLSGEVLAKESGYGMDKGKALSISYELKDMKELGVEIAISMGGGNIFRGIDKDAEGIERACADYIGYIRRRAIRHLEKGRIVIFACGTGNPFFSTDTAAALRAAEINADILLEKGNMKRAILGEKIGTIVRN